jgi:hypothetical protein
MIEPDRYRPDVCTSLATPMVGCTVVPVLVTPNVAFAHPTRRVRFAG